MRCPLVPLLLVALSAGCAREAAPPAAPFWTAAPPPAPAAAPAPEPLAWTPRATPHAAPRSNLMAAPAVAVDHSAKTADTPIADKAPGAPGMKPPAEDIAALRRMLRAAPPPPVVHRSSARIPDGSACLEMLDRFHLPYSRLDHVKGIKTPISVKVPIGGIRYRSWGTRPLVADCRFVVALEWIAPVLKQIGVTEVRYIGTYAYRMARVGRLSLHAYGLAIDIAGMVVDGTMHKVSKAFTRGMGSAGCSPAAPVLNEVACRVKAMGLFREVLTPDSNADHANHFHFGILPVGMTLAMLPRYLPGHRRHHYHHHRHETKLADQTAPKNDDTPRADDKLAKTDPGERHGNADTRSGRHARKADKRSARAGRHDGKRLAKADKHSTKADKRHTSHPNRLAKTDKHSTTHHKASRTRPERSSGHERHVAKAGHAARKRDELHEKHVAKTSHAPARTEKRTAKAESHHKHPAKTARHARHAKHAHDTRRVAEKVKKPHAERHHAEHRTAERHHAEHRTAERHHAEHRTAERHHAERRTAERHRHHGRSRKSDKR